jgi:hypothetical protein
VLYLPILILREFSLFLNTGTSMKWYNVHDDTNAFTRVRREGSPIPVCRIMTEIIGFDIYMADQISYREYRIPWPVPVNVED